MVPSDVVNVDNDPVALAVVPVTARVADTSTSSRWVAIDPLAGWTGSRRHRTAIRARRATFRRGWTRRRVRGSAIRRGATAFPVLHTSVSGLCNVAFANDGRVATR
jgi:hypothetical protein